MSPLQLSEVPRTPLAAAAPAPLFALPARFASPARHARRVLYVLPPLLIGVWAVFNWRVLYDGVAQLPSASPWWLLAAVVFDSLCWVAAACLRQGCVLEPLPRRLLLASQIAAGAANHVIPAGLGGHAITVRVMQRCGLTLTRATAAIALYSLVKPIGRMALIIALIAAFPSSVRMGAPALDGWVVILSMAGAASTLVIALAAVVIIPPLRRVVMGFLSGALADARLLHTRPSRVVALWGGAVAFPLLQASAFACVGTALGLPVPWPHMALAYLVAGVAVGAIPSPGGIGSQDAALVFILIAFGAPLPMATSAVIANRVLTAWLPLLPAAFVLSSLVRRKVI